MFKFKYFFFVWLMALQRVSYYFKLFIKKDPRIIFIKAYYKGIFFRNINNTFKDQSRNVFKSA